MIRISTKTDIGTYEVWFRGSMEKGGGELQFSQSSGGRISTNVDTKDWEHKMIDRNFDALKVLESDYKKELEEVVSEFHKKIIALQNRLKIDLENLE